MCAGLLRCQPPRQVVYTVRSVLITTAWFTNEKLRHRNVTDLPKISRLMSCGTLICCHIPKLPLYVRVSPQSGLCCSFAWVCVCVSGGCGMGLGGVNCPEVKLLTKSIVIIAAHVTSFEPDNSTRMNECTATKPRLMVGQPVILRPLHWVRPLTICCVHKVPLRFSNPAYHWPWAQQKWVWAETQLNRGCFQEPGVGASLSVQVGWTHLPKWPLPSAAASDGWYLPIIFGWVGRGLYATPGIG